ncbi:Chemotaxis protein CheD [hydrothermal vent metagenome]|uniref:Chemotaxis protein CheD n=1 Tax=hydrothermal vent metagenome TaxID=652676 RepID=A0A3B0Y7L4_9ZZZZ
MKLIPTTHKGESHDGIISRFINPGEFFFHGSDCQIHTLLGSCIAITLWHPELKVGGMCHFVLPGQRSAFTADRRNGELNGRYSDAAMALFEIEAHRRGTSLHEYHAKIFGGSNMLTTASLSEDELVGTKNTEAAIRHLSEKDIPLLVAHVGESGYRRIAFEVSSGDVWVKHELLQKFIG